jgi:hypothetical protein
MFFPRAERQDRGGGGFQLYAIVPDAFQSNTNEVVRRRADAKGDDSVPLQQQRHPAASLAYARALAERVAGTAISKSLQINIIPILPPMIQ